MRKTVLLLLAAFAGLASCGHDSALKNNAMQYAQAMADYDIDRAYPYATPETQTLTLDYFKTALIPALDTAYIASNTPATLYLDSIIHVSDTQATVYFHKKTPLQPHVNCVLDMRLRNGQWLAHQPIKHAPFIGGAVQAIDTAGLEQNIRQASAPTKIIPLGRS